MFEFPAKVKNGVSKRIADVNVKPFEPAEFTVSRKELALQNKTIAVHDSHYTIYEAEYRGSAVAVKVVALDEEKHTSDFIDTIVDLTCLAALPHDNISAFYGAGHALNPETKLREIFIVMETFEKGTLRQVLRNVLDWETKITLARDVARALAFLHSKQMIHGDVRASTVLVNEEMQAKLVDCSHLCGERSRLEVRTFNTTKGTVALSPEMARNQIYTYSADVYAFGIMLFEIITEQAPSKMFRYRDAKANFALLDKELRGAVRPGCPDALEALAYSCCTTRAAQRITSDQIVEELDFMLVALNRKTNNTRLTAAASSPQLVNRSKYTHLLLPSPPSWKGTPLRSAASDSGHAGGSFDVTPYIVGVKAPLTERAKVPLLERMNSLSSTLDVSEGLPEVDETGSSDDSDDDVPIKGMSSAEASKSADSTPPEKEPARLDDIYSPVTPLRTAEPAESAPTPTVVPVASQPSVPFVAVAAPAPAAPVRSTAKSLFAEVSSPAPTTMRVAKTVDMTTAAPVMAPPVRPQAIFEPLSRVPAAPAESTSKQEATTVPLAAAAACSVADSADGAVTEHTESAVETSTSDEAQPLESSTLPDKKSQRRKPVQAGDQAVVPVNADEALALIRNIKHIVSDARMLSDVPEEPDVLLSAAASFSWAAEIPVVKADASTSTPSSPPQDALPTSPTTADTETVDTNGSALTGVAPLCVATLPVEDNDETLEPVLAMEPAPVQHKKNRRKGQLDYSAEAAELASTTDAADDAAPVLPVESAVQPVEAAPAVHADDTVLSGSNHEVEFSAVVESSSVMDETVTPEAMLVPVEVEVPADISVEVEVILSVAAVVPRAPAVTETKPPDAPTVQGSEISHVGLKTVESDEHVRNLEPPVAPLAASPTVSPTSLPAIRVLDDVLATGRAEDVTADSTEHKAESKAVEVAAEKAAENGAEKAAEKAAEKTARKKLKKEKSQQSQTSSAHPVVVQSVDEPRPVHVLSQHAAPSVAPVAAPPVVSPVAEPVIAAATLPIPVYLSKIKSIQPDQEPASDNTLNKQLQMTVANATVPTPPTVVPAATVTKEVEVSSATDKARNPNPLSTKADASVSVQPPAAPLPRVTVQQSLPVVQPVQAQASAAVPIVAALAPASLPAAGLPTLTAEVQAPGEGEPKKKSPRKRNRNKGKNAMNSSSASLLSVCSDEGEAPVSTAEDAAVLEPAQLSTAPTSTPPQLPTVAATTANPPSFPVVSVSLAPSIASPSVVPVAPPQDELTTTQDTATEDVQPSSGNQKRRLRREKARAAAAAFTSATDQAQVLLNGTRTVSQPALAPVPAAPAKTTFVPATVPPLAQAPVMAPAAPVVVATPTAVAPPLPVPPTQLVPPVVVTEGKKQKKEKRTIVPVASQQQAFPSKAPAAPAPDSEQAPPVVKVESTAPVASGASVQSTSRPEVTVVIPARTNMVDSPNSAISTATTTADDFTPLAPAAPPHNPQQSTIHNSALLSTNTISNPAYEDRLAALERMLLSLAEENLALHRELRDVSSKPAAPLPMVSAEPLQESFAGPVVSDVAPAVISEKAPAPLSSETSEQQPQSIDVNVEVDVEGGAEGGNYDDASDSTESQLPSESESDSDLDGDSDGESLNGDEDASAMEVLSAAVTQATALELPTPAVIAPAGVMEVLKYLESMQADLLAQLSTLQQAPPVAQVESAPALMEGTPSRSLLADTLLQESIVSVLDSRLGAVQLQMSQFAAILQDLVISQSPPRTIHAGPSSYENSQISTHSSAFVTPNSGTLASTTEPEDLDESLSGVVEPRHLFSQIDQQAELPIVPQIQQQAVQEHIEEEPDSAPASAVPHSVGELVAKAPVEALPTATATVVAAPSYSLPEYEQDDSNGAEDEHEEIMSPVSPMEEALPMEPSGVEVSGGENDDVDEGDGFEDSEPVDELVDETAVSGTAVSELCTDAAATTIAPIPVAEDPEDAEEVPAAALTQQVAESSESEGEVWERKVKTVIPTAQPAVTGSVFAPRRSRAVTPVSTLDTAVFDGFPILLSADGTESAPMPCAPQQSPALSLKLPAVGGLQSVLRAAMDQQHSQPVESDEEPGAHLLPTVLVSHREAAGPQKSEGEAPASGEAVSQFQRASERERSRKDLEVSSDSSMVDVADIEYPFTRDEWEQRQHSAPAAILQLHQHHEQQQRDMLLLQQQQLQAELDASYPYGGVERIQAAQSRTTPTLHLHHVGVVPYQSASQQRAEAPLTPSSKVFNSSMRFLDEIGKLKDQMDARDGVQSSPALSQSQLRSTSRPSSRQDYSSLHQSPGELRHTQSGQPDLNHSNGDRQYYQNGRKTPPETRTAWDSETGRNHTHPHPHLQGNRHDYPHESNFSTHDQHHHSTNGHGQSPFDTAHRFTPEPVGFHNSAPSRSRSPQQPQLHMPQLIASVPRNSFQSPSPAHAAATLQIGTHSSLTNASRDYGAVRQASPTRAAELMTPQRILDLTGALNSFLAVIEKCSEITDSADLAVSQLDHNMDKLEQRSRRNLLASAEKLVSSTGKRDDATSVTSRGNVNASFRVPDTSGLSAIKAPQLPRTDTFYDAQYVEEFDDSEDGNAEQKSRHSQHTQRSQPSVRNRDLPRSRSNSNMNASLSNSVNNNVFDSKSTIKREPVHTKHFLSPSTKPALPKINRSSSKQMLSSPSFRNGDITSSSNYFKSPEAVSIPKGSVSIKSATSGTTSASIQGKTPSKPLRKEPEPVESHHQSREARSYSFASTIGTYMSGDASSVNGSISASVGVRKEEIYPLLGHPSLVRTSSRVMIDGKEAVVKSGPSSGGSVGGGGNGAGGGADSVSPEAPRGRPRSNSASSNRSHSRSHSPGRSSSPHKQGSPKEILSKHLNHTSYSFRIENQPRKVF